MKHLVIGGIAPFTTVDFPGRLAAVLFCQGCESKCIYCHNQHLRPTTSPDVIEWENVKAFINERKGLLDGVVFSGGEPLLQEAIYEAVQEVREMGFEIALHTSGINPKRLEMLLPFIDWVGLDVKLPLENYEEKSGIPEDSIKESLRILLETEIDFETRTTLDPRILDDSSVLNIAESLSKLGVRRYVLQEYRPIGDKNEPTIQERTSFFENKELMNKLSELFEWFEVRRA
ncbi:MAG: anaerobic ribonucleoside-triphosphate reductase activating protein [Alphaproteobacteria bacterium]|nr:anaerobic ribonucleoside-triphosphate reductase activating protein [Alphaproteobacteria bacterium]